MRSAAGAGGDELELHGACLLWVFKGWKRFGGCGGGGGGCLGSVGRSGGVACGLGLVVVVVGLFGVGGLGRWRGVEVSRVEPWLGE